MKENVLYFGLRFFACVVLCSSCLSCVLFRDPQAMNEQLDMKIDRLEKLVERSKDPEVKAHLLDTKEKVKELKEQQEEVFNIKEILWTMLGLGAGGLGYAGGKRYLTGYKVIKEDTNILKKGG